MSAQAPALLVLEGDGAEGASDIQGALAALDLTTRNQTKLSNVYEVRRELQQGKSFKTTIGLSFGQKMTPQEVQGLIVNMKSRAPDLKIIFAALGSEFLRNANGVLPHPELHLRPEWLVPLAEIEENFIHPVFRKRLVDLAEKYRNQNWGAFYCRGQSLLDFSTNGT